MQTEELQLEEYERNPYIVKAIQVTAENMEAVAKWCGGNIQKTKAGTKYISVKVHNPLTPRQTKAFVNDWVLFAKGYKVYTQHAFQASFKKREVQVVSEDELSHSIDPVVLARAAVEAEAKAEFAQSLSS